MSVDNVAYRVSMRAIPFNTGLLKCVISVGFLWHSPLRLCNSETYNCALLVGFCRCSLMIVSIKSPKVVMFLGTFPVLTAFKNACKSVIPVFAIVFARVRNSSHCWRLRPLLAQWIFVVSCPTHWNLGWWNLALFCRLVLFFRLHWLIHNYTKRPYKSVQK